VDVFLGFVDAFPNGSPPDLTPAQGIDLDALLPEYAPHSVDGSIPEAELKYIEGLPIDEIEAS
jgi:hypothetical protein